MDSARFREIAERYPSLRIAVLGDFCLDRYFEIDPAKEEVSIETGLPVHNVIQVRAQPGGAGTIVNNLAALGIGTIYPVGFAGDDGEGLELWRALESLPGVRMSFFVQTVQRRTFTYCKPLVLAPGKAPVELNRLDFKNWTPTPAVIEELLMNRFLSAAKLVTAIMIMDQVALPETGSVTQGMLETVKRVAIENPGLLILADSRRGLRGFPPVAFKMNASELSALMGAGDELGLERIKGSAVALAHVNGRNVFVTLAERGILGASAEGEIELDPALPVRGDIDIVGAGDGVSANLIAALAAGAAMREALEIANAAASVVIHKLGATGTASVAEIEGLLFNSRDISANRSSASERRL